MKSINEHKFCEICNNKVWNLDGKSDIEIIKLYQTNSKLCGKISNRNIISRIFLAFTLTTISCSSNQTKKQNTTENIKDNIAIITGKITAADNVSIIPKSITFITKSNIFIGRIDDNNNFKLEIPSSFIGSKNLIRIEYSKKIDFTQTYHKYSDHIIDKKDLFSSKNILADDGTKTIGAAVIISPQPPNFYYFDGEKISKRKYETIKKENKNLNEVILYDNVFKKIINTEFSDEIHLLYSQRSNLTQ